MDDPQELIQCQYCHSRVRANRMSIHIAKTHKNISGRVQCLLHTDHKVEDLDQHLQEECCAMESLLQDQLKTDGTSSVPEPPPCNIDYGANLENWDSANFPPYDAMEITKDKSVIRGLYVAGKKPAERKLVVEEERKRWNLLAEREANSDRSNIISNSPTQWNTASAFPPFDHGRNPPVFSVPITRPAENVLSSNNGTINRPVTSSNDTRQPESSSNSTRIEQASRSNNTIRQQDPDSSSNNNDTDSDGFTPVKNNRRTNHTKVVGLGRGRGRH